MISIDKRSLGLYAAALAPITLVGAFAQPITAAGGWATWFALFAAALAGFFVFTHFYMRRLDEAAWEAQKFAWLWGGVAGILAGFAVLVIPTPLRTLIGEALTAAAAEADTAAAGLGISFHLGALYILAAQMVGFFVVWVGWWVRRR